MVDRRGVARQLEPGRAPLSAGFGQAQNVLLAGDPDRLASAGRRTREQAQIGASDLRENRHLGRVPLARLFAVHPFAESCTTARTRTAEA
jgi:hypothetical protein